jgi:hypothetical protein
MDIRSIASQAKAAGARLAVDNTFLSSALQQPLWDEGRSQSNDCATIILLPEKRRLSAVFFPQILRTNA